MSGCPRLLSGKTSMGVKRASQFLYPGKKLEHSARQVEWQYNPICFSRRFRKIFRKIYQGQSPFSAMPDNGFTRICERLMATMNALTVPYLWLRNYTPVLIPKREKNIWDDDLVISGFRQRKARFFRPVFHCPSEINSQPSLQQFPPCIKPFWKGRWRKIKMKHSYCLLHGISQGRFRRPYESRLLQPGRRIMG